jgi:hypothetical protein
LAAHFYVYALGVIRSAEERAAIKARMTGNKFWLGKKPTAEHRANMSRAQKGKAPWRISPVVCLDDGREFVSVKAAAEYYGICYATISMLCSGDPRRKTAGGKKFAYLAKAAA